MRLTKRKLTYGAILICSVVVVGISLFTVGDLYQAHYRDVILDVIFGAVTLSGLIINIHNLKER